MDSAPEERELLCVPIKADDRRSREVVTPDVERVPPGVAILVSTDTDLEKQNPLEPTRSEMEFVVRGVVVTKARFVGAVEARQTIERVRERQDC
jgi:hypothetical protein